MSVQKIFGILLYLVAITGNALLSFLLLFGCGYSSGVTFPCFAQLFFNIILLVIGIIIAVIASKKNSGKLFALALLITTLPAIIFFSFEKFVYKPAVLRFDAARYQSNCERLKVKPLFFGTRFNRDQCYYLTNQCEKISSLTLRQECNSSAIYGNGPRPSNSGVQQAQ